MLTLAEPRGNRVGDSRVTDFAPFCVLFSVRSGEKFVYSRRLVLAGRWWWPPGGSFVGRVAPRVSLPLCSLV